jgi:predicted oxidoreductase
VLGFERQSSESKIYEIGISYISDKQIALIRNINNDWLARNQVNVTRWSNTSICR